MADSELTAEVARERWSYNPSNGEFTWRIATSNKRPGEIAGNLNRSDGYWRVKYRERAHQQHRVIWLMMTGAWPPELIDHIDGNPLNNRWTNLRCASIAINMQNLTRVHRTSTSGLLGVIQSRSRKRWCATINFGGKAHHLGTFDSPQEAHLAYIEAKRRHHPGNTL